MSRTIVLFRRRPKNRKTIQAPLLQSTDASSNTKVTQHRVGVGVKHDIRGLDIAMNIAIAVQHFDAAAQPDHDVKRAIHGQGHSPYLLGHIRYWAKLHLQVGATIWRGSNGIQLHHSGMAGDGGHHISLVANLRILHLIAHRARNLHGNFARGLFLTVQVHVRETTRTKRTQPGVTGQFRGRKTTCWNRRRHDWCPLKGWRRRRRSTPSGDAPCFWR